MRKKRSTLLSVRVQFTRGNVAAQGRAMSSAATVVAPAGQLSSGLKIFKYFLRSSRKVKGRLIDKS
jgi:hypothetical protein